MIDADKAKQSVFINELLAKALGPRLVTTLATI